jgi:hypothetical protein
VLQQARGQADHVQDDDLAHPVTSSFSSRFRA